MRLAHSPAALEPPLTLCPSRRSSAVEGRFLLPSTIPAATASPIPAPAFPVRRMMGGAAAAMSSDSNSASDSSAPFEFTPSGAPLVWPPADLASPPSFLLILCGISRELCQAWHAEFGRLADDAAYPYEVRLGSFAAIPSFDCVVSPANSFGIMDGGVDLAISKFFGGVEQLVPKVQKRLMDEFCGIQPVGSSILIETGCSRHPYIAHTPTMPVPQRIEDGKVVYRCMYSMLAAIHAHNAKHPELAIRSVVCPGLGTGAGGVDPTSAAKLMALAFHHFRQQRVHGSSSAVASSATSDSILVHWNEALALWSQVEEVSSRNLEPEAETD